MRTRFSRHPWLLVSLTLAAALAAALQKPGYFASMRIETGAGASLLYVNDSQKTSAECQATLDRIEQALVAHCPGCKKKRQCHQTLPAGMSGLFTDAPADYPLAHTPTGVLLFESDQPGLAQQLCDATVGSIKRQSPAARAVCYPVQSGHPEFRAQNTGLEFRHLSYAALVLLLSLLASRLTGYLVLRYEHLHARLSHDHTQSGPQKFHALPTPRIGGIPLLMGLLISAIVLNALPHVSAGSPLSLLLLAGLPVYLGGLGEDVTKRVGVGERLALSMVSGLLGCWLLGAIIPSLEFGQSGPLLLWPPLAIAFTVFAVGGVANALNIIDGYNGLAAGFGVIASSALAIAAAVHGDHFLLYANLAMGGALLGFLYWNWPRGRIFLGDGGAYLLGFWLAEMSVLLQVRNPGVSVWLPMAIMVYPVFETLYSIWRRRTRRRGQPGQPDAAHLHQLVYKRLVRVHVGSRIPKEKLARNSRVAPYFWVITGALSALALLLRDSSLALQLLALSFAAAYVLAYRKLTTWRIPQRMVMRGRPG